MSELLFEAYSTPKVSYGVDSLYSFYNSYHKSDGLIINTSSNTTSVVPVLDGKGIFSACKRVSWGGMQASDLLLRMIQLKYPAFPTKVSSIQASVSVFVFQEAHPIIAKSTFSKIMELTLTIIAISSREWKILIN